MPKQPARKTKAIHEFLGVTTIGERGQTVIPSEARTKFGLNKGEKLLVFGVNDDMIMLMKFSDAKKFIEHTEKKIQTMQNILNTVS